MVRQLAGLTALAALICSVHCTPPNIVMFVIDDLGWSDVGYHNISKIKTPNIDKLAHDGVILKNYYVQPICSPTRAALLSGRYPIHTGMQHGVVKPEEPYGLPLDLEILPQRLKKAGYSTHIVGKWHLGFFKREYTPTYRGFDTFYGLYLGATDHWTHKRMGALDLVDQMTPVKDQGGVYSSQVFSKRAEKIIKDHNSSAPFFLYLPFQSVHSPIQAPKKFTKKYKFINNTRRRIYAGMMSAVDEAIGDITTAIKSKGLWNNTLIIFTTDNGGTPKYGGYNWPLRGRKATLWEGGVKAVGFVHGEMIEKKQRVCTEMIHVTDWYPTLASLAGLKAPSGLDGFDVWSTISQGEPSPRTEVLHNIDVQTSRDAKSGSQGIALRVRDMKLLVNVKNSTWFKPHELGGKKQKPERSIIQLALYNITADPYEHHDLSKQLPDVVTSLSKRVEFYMKGVVPSRKQSPDPEAKKTAKRQGYWGPWKS